MRIFLQKLLFGLAFSCMGMFGYSQLIINPATTAQALAQKLVGDGVTISNVSFIGNLQMAGFFNNLGGVNFSIDSGIVLTCGRAKTSPGIGVDGPSSWGASQSWNLPGDPELDLAIGGGTRDACILQFDFIPLGDSIKFNYVFSSEEYTPAFVCSFNDAFAFFISGPGIPGIRNIALVPGTSTPVSIFNVNNVPGGGCPNNPSYYVNNLGNSFFTHDGHTVIFTAKERVIPCERYRLKLVIADVGDWVVDSGVFIEAESLTSNAIGMSNISQTDPVSGMSYLVEGCAIGSTFTVSRPLKDPTPLVVNLSFGGTAINGVDVATIPNIVIIPANDSFVTVNIDPIVDLLPEGIEEFKIYALAGCGAGLPTDSCVIQIRDYDILPLVPDTAMICRNGSIQLQAPVGYASYQWLPADPTLNNPAIRDPIATPVNPTSTYICTATTGNCNARDSIFLEWKSDMELISKTDVNCRNGTTGQIIVAGGPDWVAPVEFSMDGIIWQTSGTFNNVPVGNYWVKIRDANCLDSVYVSIVQAFPDLVINNLATTPAGCSGGPDGSIAVSASGGNNNYLYSIDGVNFQSSNLFNVTSGPYTITIQDGNGCLASQSTSVSFNDTVTVNAGADGTICQGSSYILPAVSNASNFSWSPAATLNNPAILNPSASPTTNTKYYLTASIGLCSKTDSVEVFIRPAPIPDAGADIDVCYGKIVQLQGNGGVTYQWSPSTYFISPTTVQNPDVKATADITYSLMVTDAFGCNSLVPDEVVVNVTPAFKIFAGNDTIAAINQPIQLQAKEIGNAGVTSWSWSPAFNLSNPNIASPVATLVADQRFIVTGTAPGGCQAMDDVLVKVYVGPDIYVPSAFTPNNDGLNDILGPVPVGIKEFKFFRVFNRWGQIVFSTSDPKRGWNGKVNGVPVSTTSFIWMAEAIDYKGNLITRKGVVTIIQ